VVIGKSIEASGTALGIRAHVLKVEPVAGVQQARQIDALGDDIDAVTGRTPDRVRDVLQSRRAWSPRLGVVSGREQDLRDGVLVVEDDVRKVAVHTVIEVEHVRIPRGIQWVWNIAPRNDVGCQSKGAGNVVAARLGNDADARGEVGLQRVTQVARELLEGLLAEAAAHVERVQFMANLGSLVEYDTGVLDRLQESAGILGARSNVEAHTNNLEVEVVGQLEQLRSHIHGGTELHAQPAEAGGVVGQNTKVELCIREGGLDLVQLVGIVKSHLLDADLLSIAQVGLRLAGLSVDDAAGIDARLKSQIDLRLGSTVESVAKLGHKTEDLGVRVTLDS